MRVIKFKGESIKLSGQELKIGDSAPCFKAKTPNFETVEFPKFLQAPKVLLFTVPSLDTPVCHNEACYLRDNSKAFLYPVVICSRDLPFAQARWAKENLRNNSNITLLSDFPYNECGKSYGVETELGLLARTVFVITDGKVQYIQVVEEITNEPDYKQVIDFLARSS